MSDTAKRIAELEKELAESINGYISRKVIKGKERFYLQWTENGKLKSRYIKAGELEQTRALVERRKSLQAELKKLKATPDGVKSYNLKRKAVRNMQNITGTLMSEDCVIATVKNGVITDADERLLPLYLKRTGNIEGWLASRAIDSHRTNSRLLKRALRLRTTDDIATALAVNAATVTDRYWFKPEGSSAVYEDIRFKENYFAELALRGDPDSFSRKPSRTPELTNTGSFEKCWKLIAGEWWMYKSGNKEEYFSELFICKLCEKLGLPTAHYELDGRYIRSKDFTNGAAVNFEPIRALVDDDEDYEDDDDEPEQKSLFVPILTAVTIVVIIVAVFFIASLIKDTFGSGNGIRSEFQMPNLVGMDYNDAKTVYPDIDIKVGSKENTEYAVDTIFEQDIEVGEPVKKGVTVKVKVSLGLKKVKVPDVTNFDYTAATASLEQDGLKYEIKRQADENVQKDYVIKTEPEAFTEVDPGSTIVVYVSDGDVPVEIKMPKFIGKDIDTAKEQSYLEGEIVPSKTEITLTVSNGIPPKQQVTINFNIPANAQGRFRFALYYQGEVIGEKSDVNVGYTGTVSVTVEGNGTQEVIAELTNLSTGMATTIGTYKVYFDQNTYDEMSMNMDEKINDAFMAIGGIATQPPATEATTATEPVYTEETTEPYEETTAPEETTATEETY